MRIKKQSRKRASQSETHELILRLEEAYSDVDILAILKPIDTWKQPKTDLLYWINVLNRFDQILERTCKDYGLADGQVQVNEFTPNTKALVLAILSFSRILLKHATNKKIYNSYDRINDLYLTRDLEVLEATLRLAFRPAQYYKRSDAVATERLSQLATGWNVREYGLNLIDLAQDKAVIPPELSDVRFSYYRQASASKAASAAAQATPTATPSTARNPAAPQQEVEGMVNLNFGRFDASEKDVIDFYEDAVETHKIPAGVRLLLLQKIRIAACLPDATARHALLSLRLLALAVLVSVASDSSLQSKLFIYEPELVPQIAELVHPDRHVSVEIKTTAWTALEALCRVRHKTSEVLNAVNVSVSHGIILGALRKAVEDVSLAQPTLTDEYHEALFVFLNSVQSYGNVGAMLINSGLTPLLIDFVRTARPGFYKNAIRSIALIDILATNFNNAATTFMSGRGVTVFVDQVKALVENGIAEHSANASPDATTCQLPGDMSQFLRALLRSIVRMMSSAGTTGELRNLVDTTLPASIKLMMQNAVLFGPQIFGSALNVLSNFIHNEPTSLAVIQEQGLPEAFYNSIENSIAPSYDVIAGIPQTIGALCLNEPGREQFAQRSILPKLFGIFTSEKHVKVMLEKEHASMFGAHIDELVRHHPATRDAVIQAILQTLKDILAAGQDYQPPSAAENMLKNAGTSVPVAQDFKELSTEVTMAEPSSDTAVSAANTTAERESGSAPKELEKHEELEKSNVVLSFIDVVGRFLEGFLQNQAHSKEFLKTEGVDLWCSLLFLPCIPPTFLHLGVALSVSSLLKTVGEVAAVSVITALLKALRVAMLATQTFWDEEPQQTLRLMPLLTCRSDQDVESANIEFRRLIALQAVTGILEVVLPHLAYAHNRGTITQVMQAFSNTSVASDSDNLPRNTLESLGRLHRATMRENVLLKLLLSEEIHSSSDKTQPDTIGELQLSPLLPTHPALHSGFFTAADQSPASFSKHNWQAIKALIAQSVQCIEGIFIGLVGKPPPRRPPDSIYRKEAINIAKTIGAVMANHLEPMLAGHETLNVAYAAVAIRADLTLIDKEKWIPSSKASLLFNLAESGGLEKLLQLFENFLSMATASLASPDENREQSETMKLQILQAYGGMRIALDLLMRFAACKIPDTGRSEGELAESDKLDIAAFAQKCHAKILPIIARTWQSRSLQAAPPNVVRLVLKIIVAILSSQANQETEAAFAESVPSNAVRRRALGPSENRIRQCVDMGFPREAAVLALRRHGNNVVAATEYLISNPDIVAEYATDEMEEAHVPIQEPAAVPEVTADTLSSNMEVDKSEPIPPVENLAAQLKEQCDKLRKTLFKDALGMLSTYDQLIFDLRDACVTFGNQPTNPSYADLLKEVVSQLMTAAEANQTSACAAHLRLLALLTSDNTKQSLIRPLAQDIFKIINSFLQGADSNMTDRRWFASLLLATSNVIAFACIPKAKPVDYDAEESNFDSEQVMELSLPDGLQQLALSAGLGTIDREESTSDAFTAALQLLVTLTRSWSTAARLSSQDLLPSIVKAVLACTTEHTQELVMFCLRHSVETPQQLRSLFKADISSWLHRQNGRHIDMMNFVPSLKHAALRDPVLFIDCVRETCKLDEVNAPLSASQFEVKLLSYEEAAKNSDEPTNSEAQVGAIMHHLISQILKTYRSVLSLSETGPQEGEATKVAAAAKPDLAKPSIETTASLPPSAKGSGKNASPDPTLSSWLQIRVLLACLAEMLHCYMPCKAWLVQAFVTDDTVRTFMDFVLLDATAKLQTLPDGPRNACKNLRVSEWLNLVLQSTCASPTQYNKYGKSDFASDKALATAQVFVLDRIKHALVQISSPEAPAATRYAQLAAMSEACYVLLSAQKAKAVGRSTPMVNETMAQRFIEADIPASLTAALSIVDLNYPHVRSLINKTLKPLQLLSQYSRRVGKAKIGYLEPVILQGSESEEEEDQSSNSDVPASPHRQLREETPDIYRHSALGMFQGELEGNNDVPPDDYMSIDGGGVIIDDEDDDMAEIDAQGLTVPSDESDADMDGDSEAGDMEGDDNQDDDDEESSDDSDLASEMEDAMHMQGPALDMGIDMDLDGGEEVFGSEGGMHPAFDGFEDDEDAGQMVADLAAALDDAAGADDDETDQDGVDETGGVVGDDGEASSEDGDDMPDAVGYSSGNFNDEDSGQQMLPGDAMTALAELDAMDQHDGDDESPEDMPDIDLLATPQAGGFGMHRGPRPAMAFVTGAPLRDTPAHPLLIDNTTATPTSQRAPRRSNRATSGPFGQMLQAIGEQLGQNAFELFEQVLESVSAMNNNNTAQQFQLVTEDGQIAADIRLPAGLGRTAMPQMSIAGHIHNQQVPPSDRSGPGGQLLMPTSTQLRWEQEARLIFGTNNTVDQCSTIANHLLSAMLPAANKEASKKKAERQAEKEKEKAEAIAAKQVESDASTKADGAPAAELVPMDAEATPSAEVLLPTQTETSLLGRNNLQPALADSASNDVEMNETLSEVVALARSIANEMSALNANSVPFAVPTSLPLAEPYPTAISNEEVTVGADHEAALPAQADEAPIQRITTTINGQTVDITDTGIDPTFLEALPEDMREEVLNQHFSEVRATSAQRSNVPDTISREFLDALPPEIRAEVLAAEAAEASRHQRLQAALQQVGAESSGPADIDPASFLATLDHDPALRREILIQQMATGGEDFLNLLPPSMLAEVEDLRQAASMPRRAFARSSDPRLGGRRSALEDPGAAGPSSRKDIVERDAIQLLDKAGVATLIRLLFFPQQLEKGLLQTILTNLCDDVKTRAEIINTLLSVLQEGTQDTLAVDRSFSHMTAKASKIAGAQRTPASVRRKDELPMTVHVPGENAPNLVVQRCLDAFYNLVKHKEAIAYYFLTEQDSLANFNRRAPKKSASKGKEKATGPPLPIVILLSLLERPALINITAVMDTLTILLAAITKNLAVLAPSKEDGKKSLSDAAPKVSEIPSATAEGEIQANASDDAHTQVQAAESNGTVPIDSVMTEPSLKPATEPSYEQRIKENPPQIPPEVLALVVNILDGNEVSSRAFQDTLSIMHHLGHLPKARDVIFRGLSARIKTYAQDLLPHLKQLGAQLETASKVSEVGTDLLALFSSASSQQTKLLRVLKTIDYIHSKRKDSTNSIEQEEEVKAIYASFSFDGVWDTLSSCLTAIEDKDDLSHAGTILLPLIESFMVVSRYASVQKDADGRPKISRGLSFTPSSPVAQPLTLNDAEGRFLVFTRKHRKLLNTMVRQNPTLMSGSFSILVQNPAVLEFENKRNYFNQQAHKRSSHERHGTLAVNVRRQYVFEDSFQSLGPARRSPEHIKYGKLSVRFYDEEGVDAGGVTREWYSTLARSIFNPNYALFQPSSADQLVYQPNPHSYVNADHLPFFTFVGRIIGKSVFDGRLLEAYFTKAFYKHLLGLPVDLRDVESVDPDAYRSLVWMLEHPIEGVLDLTFSVEADEWGVTKIVDLKPGGREIAVTDTNKREYVDLVVKHRLTDSIAEQIQAFVSGFTSIIPKDLVSIFNASELQLLISGLPDIDVDEWRANTDLSGYTASSSSVVWFWRAVRSFSQEERAKLLQFVTGSSRVPLEGFGALQGVSGNTKFTIVAAHKTDVLPSAHSCFNQIDLPTYTSYEDLRRLLLLAITETEGFGFA